MMRKNRNFGQDIKQTVAHFKQHNAELEKEWQPGNIEFQTKYL